MVGIVLWKTIFARLFFGFHYALIKNRTFEAHYNPDALSWDPLSIIIVNKISHIRFIHPFQFFFVPSDDFVNQRDFKQWFFRSTWYERQIRVTKEA